MDLSKEQIDRIITIAETIGNAIADFIGRSPSNIFSDIGEEVMDDIVKDWGNLPFEEQFDLTIPYTRVLELTMRSSLVYSVGLNGAGYMIMEKSPENEYFSKGQRFQVIFKPWDVDGKESKYYEVIGIPGRLVGSREKPRYIREKSTEELYSKRE